MKKVMIIGCPGAGKSTLMKILSGTYSNYGGSVICKGEEIHMKCEKDAFKYGISIVAQELNYVSELSIAENLFNNIGLEANGLYQTGVPYTTRENNYGFSNDKEKAKQ